MRGRVQKLRAEVRTVDPFTAAAFSDEEIDENVRNCEGNHMCAAQARADTRAGRARLCAQTRRRTRTHLCDGDGRTALRLRLRVPTGSLGGANEANKETNTNANTNTNTNKHKQTTKHTQTNKREIGAGQVARGRGAEHRGA